MLKQIWPFHAYFNIVLKTVFWILYDLIRLRPRIRTKPSKKELRSRTIPPSRIRKILGHTDPDPLVRGSDPSPDPTIFIKNSKKNIDSHCSVTSS